MFIVGAIPGHNEAGNPPAPERSRSACAAREPIVA